MNAAWLARCETQACGADEGIDTSRLTDPATGSRWLVRRAPQSHGEAYARLQRELRFMRRFAADIEQPLPVAIWTPDCLHLAYQATPGLRGLQELAGRMPLAAFLELAAACAGALAKWHAAGTVHGDLRLAHMLADDSANVLLIAASSHAGEAATSAAPGARAYRAPELEQGGGADASTDLYALGVVLFRLLTASWPWPEHATLDWKYAHSAIEPVSLRSVDAQLPAQLDSILARLLAKNPQARYGSASSLQRDLWRCHQEFAQGQAISQFEPDGAGSLAGNLQSSPLFGREPQVAQLEQVLQRVCRDGGTEVVMLCGPSGVGKSALVRQLLQGARAGQARIGAGKCELLGAQAPFGVVGQALRSLTLGALGEEQAALEQLSERWRGLLSGQAPAIVELVPEARHILGELPQIENILPMQGNARVDLALVRSVEAFARPGLPTVLVLDDLQWADDATLVFLESFIAASPANVLLVGVYRDNAGALEQRLLQVRHANRHAHVHFTEIRLDALPLSAFTDMVALSLRQPGRQLDALAARLHAQAGGNPYFAQHLLQSWIGDGALTLSSGGDGWQWREDKLPSTGYAEHVVELVIQRISRLPLAQRSLLQQLAFVGQRCELPLLARLSHLDSASLAQALEQLEGLGLLSRQAQSCAFQHDRVLEAAYALTPAAQRSAGHAHVARQMIAYWDAGHAWQEQRDQRARLEQHAYDIGNQLEKVDPVSIAGQERPLFAQVLLLAARRAQRSSALEQTTAYTAAAMALMEPGWWQQHFSLVYEASVLQCESLLAQADLAAASAHIEALLRRALPHHARASVHRLEAVLHTVRSDYEQAIEAALAGLRILDVPLRRHPTTDDMQAALAAVVHALDGRTIAQLGDLPTCEDPRIQSAMMLLSTLVSSFFVADDISFTHLAKMVELTLKHGATPGSPYGLAWFGVFIADRFDQVESGYAYAQAALALIDQQGFEAARIATLVALDQVAVWTQPLEVALDYVQRARRYGISSGDIGMACYACNHIVSDLLAMGESLPLVEEEAAQGIALTRSIGYHDIELLIESQRHFAQEQVRGHGDDLTHWHTLVEQRGAGAQSLTTKFWVWLYAGMSLAYHQQWTQAARYLARAAELVRSVPAHISLSDCHLFGALAMARGGQAELPQVVQALRQACERFQGWAGRNPGSFQNKLLLLQAELARVEGNSLKALALFESSARAAAAAGFVHEQALAHELAAGLCREHALGVAGAGHARLARAAYLRWGALAKAHAMGSDDGVVTRGGEAADEPGQGNRAGQEEALQLGLKAAQAWSGEAVREKLVHMLMSDLLIHAGAQYGLLVRVSEGKPLVEASARFAGEGIVTSIAAVEPSDKIMPMPLLNTVMRTRQAIALHDAATDGLSIRIEREQAVPLRSVLCLPLLRGGALIGLMYLENNLAPGVFDAARVLRLELMAPQIAIALESARLYEQLIAHSEARTSAERHLHAARAELVNNAHLTVLANLAASIAHEINQPLGAIVTSAEAALRWLNRAEPEIARAQSGLQRVRKEGLRAADIVRALRSLASQAPAVLQRLAVDQMVGEMLALLGTELAAGEVRVVQELAPGIAIDGDRVQLQQLILNLLNNAAEAMQEHASGLRELRVSVALVDDSARISIQDNGPGLSEEALERIFDPFYTTKDSGLGMGLAICRTIAEAHGGTLVASSTPGEGACFIVEIPCISAELPG